MTKRLLIAIPILAAIAAVAITQLRTPTVVYPGKNVLLITLCSVSPSHMGCYGYDRDTTPVLDAFVEDAVVFEHAVTAWPKTAPAFASLLTGKYPHTTGVMRVTPGRFLADEHPTLGEVFSRGGFATGAFLTSVAIGRKTNLPRGFDELAEAWRGTNRYHHAVSKALRWIQGQHDKPFFAWVHLNSAHYDYTSHGERKQVFLDDAFYDAGKRLPPLDPGRMARMIDLPADYPHRDQIMRSNVGNARRFGNRPEELDYYVALYDAAIRAADVEIGRLLNGLEETGLLDETIVAVVGDHGEALGGHDYFFEHGRFAYDDCARVPLLLRLPRGEHSHRVPEPVPASSLAPTLYDLVGLTAPPGIEFPSLVPVILGARFDEVVFAEAGYHPDFLVSARDHRWKLIHIPNRWDRLLTQGKEYELYDLANDPDELHELSSEHPDVVKRLRGEIESFAKPWRAAVYAGRAQKGVDIDEEYRERLRALGYLE